MSDFIKVNLKSGYSFVAHKNTISLVEGPCGRFYVQHLNGQLSILSELLTIDGFSNKEERLEDARLFSQIDKQEYDRLCTELSVS